MNDIKIFNEQTLKDNCGESVQKTLRLWKTLSKQAFGYEIEIGLANRNRHPQLKNFRGELNTAIIHTLDNKVKLIIYVESTRDVRDIIVSHEIIHWILKLQGFRAYQNRDKIHSNREMLLNSMAHHVPLYKLQKELGLDPIDEINSRTKSNRLLFSRDKEPKNIESVKTNALLIADDLINCSKFRKKKYTKLLIKKHPKTIHLAQIILEQANKNDLLDIKSNQTFEEAVIKELDLGKNWHKLNELDSIRKQIKALK